MYVIISRTRPQVEIGGGVTGATQAQVMLRAAGYGVNGRFVYPPVSWVSLRDPAALGWISGVGGV